MYQACDQADSIGQGNGGPATGVVTLLHTQMLTGAGPQFARRVRRFPSGRLRGGLARLRDAIERRCHSIDLAPDLAEDIGSARWFRGLGTMLGLAVAAISFWPDFTAVEAASTVGMDEASRDEFRSQMIMPLALGADSGRRMAATALVAPLASAPERPTVQLTATLGKGDSFGRMLQRAGVGAADAARLSGMVAANVPLGNIDPGTQFDIVLGRRPAAGAPRPLEELNFRARFDLDLAIERQDGLLVLERRPIAVDDTPLRITGRVGSGLYRSARSAGAPVKAIQQYIQAIDQHISLERDIAEGDTFDIVVAYKRSAKGDAETGDLLYAGLKRGNRSRLQLLRWGKDGQFFEASGIGTQRMRQYAPVAGRMTSGFGMRMHPILGYRRMHAGVDFGARYGSPIFAVADGVVSYAGRHGGHGNYVRLNHGGGVGTGYAHMSRIAVASGTRVHAGQVIGYVGSSGLSTGPHLHFEAYSNGKVVNPLSMKFTTRASIDPKELQAFKARLAALQALAPGAALASLAPKQAEVQEPVREIDRLDN